MALIIEGGCCAYLLGQPAADQHLFDRRAKEHRIQLCRHPQFQTSERRRYLECGIGVGYTPKLSSRPHLPRHRNRLFLGGYPALISANRLC